MPSEILFKIYYLLRTQPFTIREIYNKISQDGINLSKRSIYRYVERIEQSLDPGVEQFETSIGKDNKQIYFIRNITRNNITTTDWINFLNKNTLLKKTIFDSRHKDDSTVDNIWQLIEKSIPLKAKYLKFKDEYINPSGFGFYRLTEENLILINKFLQFIENSELIYIQKYDNESIVDLETFLPKCNTPLVPIQMIFHRGSFAFDIYSIDMKKRIIIDMEQVLDFHFHSNNYNITIHPTELEIETFGYHQPILNDIFNIQFKFNKTPGIYISKRQWHKSQNFIIHGDHVIMQLRCKIDIELLGWIAMWMDDITIIEPEILKKIVTQKIQKTLTSLNI